MLRKQGLFELNQSALKNKLLTALKYAKITCVLGSDNKFEDIEKTGGWSNVQRFRYDTNGQYFNINSDYKKKYYKVDQHCNYHFSFSKQKFLSQSKTWYYHPNKFIAGNIYLSLFNRGTKSPLYDPQFNLQPEHLMVLHAALITIERRQGNCLCILAVIAKFLWENHAGIHRIEIVPTSTFDHCLMIVNRAKDSDLSKPDTWGEAWVIDGWFENGIVFHAADFKKKIIEIKKFAKVQGENLEKIGLFQGGNPLLNEKEEVLQEYFFDINPSVIKYPTYSTSPFLPLEYYYIVANGYTLDLHQTVGDITPVLDALKLHKVKFKDCLTQLNKKL